MTTGLKALKARRLDTGGWQSFPFYYALLALSETELPEAIAEMKHAASACERYLKKRAKDDEIVTRRRALAERALSRC